MKKITSFFVLFCFMACQPTKVEETKVEFYDFEPIYIKAQHKTKKNSNVKTKFYNFDDLLINGQYKKPQVLYTDSRQKVKFGRLLKLKKDFLPKLKNSAKDPTLR
jgi:hypothetical protein